MKDKKMIKLQKDAVEVCVQMSKNLHQFVELQNRLQEIFDRVDAYERVVKAGQAVLDAEVGGRQEDSVKAIQDLDDAIGFFDEDENEDKSKSKRKK